MRSVVYVAKGCCAVRSIRLLIFFLLTRRSGQTTDARRDLIDLHGRKDRVARGGYLQRMCVSTYATYVCLTFPHPTPCSLLLLLLSCSPMRHAGRAGWRVTHFIHPVPCHSIQPPLLVRYWEKLIRSHKMPGQ